MAPAEMSEGGEPPTRWKCWRERKVAKGKVFSVRSSLAAVVGPICS